MMILITGNKREACPSEMEMQTFKHIKIIQNAVQYLPKIVKNIKNLISQVINRRHRIILTNCSRSQLQELLSESQKKFNMSNIFQE